MPVNDLQTLRKFLGWCSVINVVFLCLASILLTVTGDSMAGLHSQMFTVSREAMSLEYVHYLANYKIAIIVLNIVPYVALRLMAR
jgi:hypothetical protein